MSNFCSLKERVIEAIGNSWKTLSEGFAANRIMSTYLLSYMTSFEDSERFKINHNTFLKCIARPKCPIGSILILQGGVRHIDSNTYYVRTACSFIPKDVQVFLYEKTPPMVNFEFAHDVAACLDYIKTNFPGPVVVIGYSMGGVLLYRYLSLGYDQADLYLPVCCPLNLTQFHQTIENHALFSYLQEKAFQEYQVNSHEELLALAGTTPEKHEKFLQGFIPGLNKHSQWPSKTIYIVSSDDPITPDYCGELNMLKNPPLTYQVKGGWHCCLDSIVLSTKLAASYFKERKNHTYQGTAKLSPDLQSILKLINH